MNRLEAAVAIFRSRASKTEQKQGVHSGMGQAQFEFLMDCNNLAAIAALKNSWRRSKRKAKGVAQTGRTICTAIFKFDI
jgi:hypothetical protein